MNRSTSFAGSAPRTRRWFPAPIDCGTVLLGSTSSTSEISVHCAVHTSSVTPTTYSHSSRSLSNVPLPHDSTHTDGEFASASVQTYPGSTSQRASQPSPAITSLSSHSSPRSTMPFPHVDMANATIVTSYAPASVLS